MNLNIDMAIVIAFLVINLLIGLFYSRHVKNITDYALGGRDFRSSTLAITIIATWVGGSTFALTISKAYSDGVVYFLASCGMVITLLITAYVFAPRMQEFLGKLSVAEVMNDLYGKHVRIITAISGIIISLGLIAVQIKVIAFIFEHFTIMNPLTAAVISSTIVIIYSTMGGVRAVTFTDLFQFITFGTIIPLVTIIIWHNAGGYESALSNLPSTHLGIPDNFSSNLTLFLDFLIPGLYPAIVQRMLMSRNTLQMQRSFTISAVAILPIKAILTLVGFIIFSAAPDLEPNSVPMYIIDNYTPVGIKGLVLVGIIAMSMSTTDSFLNSSSVLFSHDFCKPLGWLKSNSVKQELFLSRIFSVVIGILAIFLAVSFRDLLELLLFTTNFYVPIVTVPLILAIMGFRSSSKVCLSGMGAGGLTVIVWKLWIQPKTGIDSLIPGMSANLLTMFLVHYLGNQPGGWIGPKDRSALVFNQQYRKNMLRGLKKNS